jgi:hypothetical protein
MSGRDRRGGLHHLLQSSRVHVGEVVIGDSARLVGRNRGGILAETNRARAVCSLWIELEDTPKRVEGC